MNRFDVRRSVPVMLAMLALGVPGCRCCRTIRGGPVESTVVPGPAGASSPSKVLVEMVIVEDSEGRTAPALPSVPNGQSYAVLSAESARSLRTLAEKSHLGRIVQMPSIVTRSGEEATIEIGDTSQAGVWIGSRMSLTPTVDGTSARFTGSIHMPAFDANLQNARVRPGETILIASHPSASPQAGRTFALLHATVIPN
jgi:hypothetical protein